MNSSDDRWLDGDPFRREGLWNRIGPFAVVAFLAEASIALPPGPASSNYTWMSAVFLFATVVGCLLPWERLPVAANVIVPVLYVGSVLTLNLAAGGSTSGVGIVILMPLVWAALYHRPYQSGIVVAAVLVYQLITSLIPERIAGAVMTRRLVFWFALATLVSFATHQLRSQIRRMLDQREELIEQRESALDDLTKSFERLRNREHESQMLIDLGDTLQSSSTVLEARGPVKETLVKLFEGGAISVVSVSEDVFETTVSWGPDDSPRPPFVRSECWALQMNQPHFADDPEGACSHRVDPAATVALCMPMIAHGDTIGVFQVYSYDSAANTFEEARANLSRLAWSVAEQLGLALANFRLRDSLREQAIRDPLTNLFNRRYMEETFSRELSRAARDHVAIGVMQIDIDYFKQFNDTYGHDVGDALLRSFADLLIALFRDSDVPCRYGGEEFTLILIKSSPDETEERARELQRKFAELPLEVGRERAALTPPTLSIGVASYPEHGDSAESLIRAADQALYAAKSRGRDLVVRAAPVSAV